MSAKEEVTTIREWDGVARSYLPPEGPFPTMPIAYWGSELLPDPITFEVVRHRLYGVAEEQGLIITRVSGSPVATFAHDFATGLLTARAENVYFGPYNQPQVGSIDFVTKWILQNRSSNPGISEGDMFLCNDPWIGTPHQADVVIVCPVFWEETLLCWVGATMHCVDVGGSTPGGFCPDAQSIYDEPLPTPAIKYVEAGAVRRDVEEMFLRRSRLPELLRLDLRALIASNSVARDRVLELVRRFGADVVVGTMNKVIDDAERAIIRRLDALPDGEWSDFRYIDVARVGDRGVYRVSVQMRKEEQRLVFANRGTDPATGALSTTVGGWRAGTLAAINPMLGYDLMHATGGLLRRVSFEPEPDTILSAAHPTAVSNNNMGHSAANSLATACVSRMLALSRDKELRKRAMAVPATPFPVNVLSGRDASGQRYGSLSLDPMGGGLGAFAVSDGADTGGRTWDPIATMPNVEYAERYFPVLYLYRRELRDSGGAGTFRGGNSGVAAFVAHGVDEIIIDISAGGWALPWSAGLFGGLPGSTNGSRHAAGAAVVPMRGLAALPQSLEETGVGVEPLPPRVRNLRLREGDIYELRWCGAGGVGDPAGRSSDSVGEDLAQGAVSQMVVDRFYATAPPVKAEIAGVPQLDVDTQCWLCPRCGAQIGTNENGQFLCRTTLGSIPIDQVSPINEDPRLFVDADMTLCVRSCAGCGCWIETYIAPEGEGELTPTMRLATYPEPPFDEVGAGEGGG